MDKTPKPTTRRRLTLVEWAALADVLASLAVVASLVFVVVSINQNTRAIQAANETTLYEMHGALANLLITDASLAELLARRAEPRARLNPVEQLRYDTYELNLLDVWSIAHSRNERELLSQTQWDAWDNYFTELFSAGPRRLTRQRWNELEYGYEAGFWEHVGRRLFDPAADSPAD